jgi:hypothetical protein
VLVFLGSVAKIYLNLSDGAKKYQQAFLVLLSGMDSIFILGDCLRNANKKRPAEDLPEGSRPPPCLRANLRRLG